MLIIDRHSIHFGLFRSTSSIRSSSVYFSPLWSIQVQFSLLRSTSVQLGSFGLLQSIQSNQVYSVQLDQFGSLQSISVHLGQFGPIQSTLVHSVHFNWIWFIRSNSVQIFDFGLFGPLNLLRSIRSTLVHSFHFNLFNPLDLFQIISVQFNVPI